MTKESLEEALKRGEELFSLQQLDEAEAAFQAVLEQEPRHSETLNNMGVICFARGNSEKAEQYFSDALAADGNNIEALSNLADLYQSSNRKDKELECLEQIAALRPEDRDATSRLAVLYVEMIHQDKQPEASKASKPETTKLRTQDSPSVRKATKRTGKLCIVLLKDWASSSFKEKLLQWVQEIGYTFVMEIDKDLTIDRQRYKKIIILYDLTPIDWEIEEGEKYPDIDNKRYLNFSSLGSRLDKRAGAKNSISQIAATRNNGQAQNILDTVLADRKQQINRDIQTIENDFSTSYPVIETFGGYRRRAKTELIKYGDGLAVKKTWKPGLERFVERERFAYGELSKKFDFIAPLLESGHNYIIIPYHDDVLTTSDKTRKEILSGIPEVLGNMLYSLYQEGYFNADMNPLQFVYSEKEGLQLLDFEYLQKYESRPASFEDSYDIIGWPKDFTGDKPVYAGKNVHHLYRGLWIQHTGFSVRQLAMIAQGDYSGIMEDPLINSSVEMVKHLCENSSIHGYQPLYCAREYRDYLPDINHKRDPEVRWNLIKQYLPAQGSYIDIGSQHGYYVFRMAEEGFKSTGIELNPLSHAISTNLIPLNRPTGTVSFYNYPISEESISKLAAADVISCFAVFHWWIVQYGYDRAVNIMRTIKDRCRKQFYFETGQSNESFQGGKYIEFMGDDPKSWISDFLIDLGFSRVTCIGEDWVGHVQSTQPRYIFLAENL